MSAGCDSSSAPADGGSKQDASDQTPPVLPDASMQDGSSPPDGSPPDGSPPGTNRAPTAHDDEITVGEDGPAHAGRVPVATDPDGNLDADGYALVTDIEVGALVFGGDGRFTFDPTGTLDELRAGATRALRFRYTARDESGAVSAPATIDVQVIGANDAPVVAAALADQSVIAGTAYESALPAETFSDVDAGDTLTWSVSGLPAWLSFDASTRTLHGTPQAGDAGDVSLTVTATDEAGATASAGFVLRVLPPPSVPQTVIEHYTYDAAGRLKQVVYGDTHTVTYDYDPAGNVLRQEVVAP